MHFVDEEKRIEVFNRDSVSAAIPTIPQGGSYRFKFDRAGEDISGWVCLIELKKFPDDAAIISKILTEKEKFWEGILTQTETAPLEVDLYYLTAKLTDASTDEEEQIITRLRLSKAWI